MLIFDIETEPLPIDTLKLICDPFDTSSIPDPGSFDPNSVRLGNMTDQAKIDAKVETARGKHVAAVEAYKKSLDEGEGKYWAEIHENAALYARTGRICAIGYLGEKDRLLLQFAEKGISEQMLLRTFWKHYQGMESQKRLMVGWNIFDFDIPFIVQRSFINSIDVPTGALNAFGSPNQIFIDLMRFWRCGSRPTGKTKHGIGSASLNAVAKSCGTPGKTDGCSGADFATMLRSEDPKQRALAEEYLTGDLVACKSLADRFGIR